ADPPRPQVLEGGAGDPEDVEAVVIEELLVLRGDEGLDELLGNALVGDDLASLAEELREEDLVRGVDLRGDRRPRLVEIRRVRNLLAVFLQEPEEGSASRQQADDEERQADEKEPPPPTTTPPSDEGGGPAFGGQWRGAPALGSVGSSGHPSQTSAPPPVGQHSSAPVEFRTFWGSRRCRPSAAPRRGRREGAPRSASARR